MAIFPKIISPDSEERFISLYFLQILTKPCRTPLIREHLSLNASWFSYARTQKKLQLFGKFDSEKYFIVNNNNKIIREWYLREVLGEHTYLPKKTRSLPVKIFRNYDVFVLQK